MSFSPWRTCRAQRTFPRRRRGVQATVILIAAVFLASDLHALTQQETLLKLGSEVLMPSSSLDPVVARVPPPTASCRGPERTRSPPGSRPSAPP